MGSLTIERHIGNLLRSGRCPEAVPAWPPDVFALVTSVLHRSGAYVRVLEDWPPFHAPGDWTADIVRAGREWRDSAGARAAPPPEVSRWWAAVIRNGATPLADAGSVQELWQALVQLAAAADEACAHVGLSLTPTTHDPFAEEVGFLLLRTQADGTTLCVDVDDSLVRVVPKSHTPQSGATVRSLSHHLDGVVLPELALDEAARLEVRALARELGVFVVTGVGRRVPTPNGEAEDENLVYFNHSSGEFSVEFEQHKHHRWKLDRSQIVQYGLGGTLDPTRQWWEATALRPRSLRFVALESWLTMCVLICEDLARQDPVAQLVRSIGPNLVIALLMDGPQSAARWPARYATVLAEDPGCSVLTLTCAGMAALARPPAGVARSRSVAMWKDPSGGTTEIELPDGAAGVVLSLARERVPEWTADGRKHEGDAGRLVLAGQHVVRT